jgi:hypothetical protein
MKIEWFNTQRARNPFTPRARCPLQAAIPTETNLAVPECLASFRLNSSRLNAGSPTPEPPHLGLTQPPLT